MWLVIGGIIGALAVLLVAFVLWFNKNYIRIMLDRNEKTRSLAIKVLPVLTWIDPDSEHGALVQRLYNLTIISEKQRAEIHKLNALGKTQFKLAVEVEELTKSTAEMFAIMEQLIGNDPLYDANLFKKLAKLAKK